MPEMPQVQVPAVAVPLHRELEAGPAGEVVVADEFDPVLLECGGNGHRGSSSVVDLRRSSKVGGDGPTMWAVTSAGPGRLWASVDLRRNRCPRCRGSYRPAMRASTPIDRGGDGAGSAYPALRRPVTIGSLELPNRIVMAPMTTYGLPDPDG